MKGLLIVLCLIFVGGGVRADAEIQLLDFDHLLQLTQSDDKSGSGGEEARQDRSLLNTFPFNQLESSSSSSHLSSSGSRSSSSFSFGTGQSGSGLSRFDSQLNLFGSGNQFGKSSTAAGFGSRTSSLAAGTFGSRASSSTASSFGSRTLSSGAAASRNSLFGTFGGSGSSSGHVSSGQAAGVLAAGRFTTGQTGAARFGQQQSSTLFSSAAGGSSAGGLQLSSAAGGLQQFGSAAQVVPAHASTIDIGNLVGLDIQGIQGQQAFPELHSSIAGSSSGGAFGARAEHAAAIQQQQAAVAAVRQQQAAVVQQQQAAAAASAAHQFNSFPVVRQESSVALAVPAPVPASLPAPVAAPVQPVQIAAPKVQIGRKGLIRRRLKVNPNRARNPALVRDRPILGEVVVAAAVEQKCIEKIEHVEEIEYDEREECHHSYDKKCHTSYSTEYSNQQELECEDNFKKECDITYSPSATNETVRVCSRPLIKDCNLQGPQECRTEYVAECWTKNEEHTVIDDVPECQTVYEEKCHGEVKGYTTEEKCSKWPKEVCSVNKKLKTKYTPQTKCEKVPQKLCGPAGCGFVEGPEQCYDKVKTVVVDLPNEVCDLQPRTQCDHVTKLVPKLVPVEECVDVPKEVCNMVRGPGRKVLKPVTKEWCYTPSPESGLH